MGLFESDGYADARRYEYYTASDELAKQVQLMLLNFGIISALEHHKRRLNPFTGKVNNIHANSVTITGSNLDIFDKEIGFISGYKKQKLSRLHLKSNDNKNIIPHIAKVLRKFKAKFQVRKLLNGVPWYYEMPDGRKVQAKTNQTGAEDFTYPLLESGSMDIKEIEKILPEQANHLQWCLNTNVYWEEITSIRKLKERIPHMDLTMPKHAHELSSHCYVANGFVVHNCNAEDLAPIAFDPNTRKLIKVGLPSSKEGAKNFERLMGKNAEYRKLILGLK